MLEAQAHEAGDNRHDDEELGHDLLGKDGTNNGHVDHEVGEHTFNQQACRVLLQLAHGQGGNEVGRVDMALLRRHAHCRCEESRTDEVEERGHDEQPQALAPANLLIDGAVDHIHHAAGSQFGAQDNDGKKAEAEEQSEDRSSEALCMLFDGLSQNRGNAVPMTRYTPVRIERTAKRPKDASRSVTFLFTAAAAVSLRDMFLKKILRPRHPTQVSPRHPHVHSVIPVIFGTPVKMGMFIFPTHAKERFLMGRHSAPDDGSKSRRLFSELRRYSTDRSHNSQSALDATRNPAPRRRSDSAVGSADAHARPVQHMPQRPRQQMPRQRRPRTDYPSQVAPQRSAQRDPQQTQQFAPQSPDRAATNRTTAAGAAAVRAAGHSQSATQRAKNAWWRSGKLRIAVGVVATIAIASTIHQAVKPPEGLEERQIVAESAPVIEPSAAVELYIPHLQLHAEFEPGNCRVLNGSINPKTMDKACTYTADDKPYSLPGTDAPDISVIAGHTGAGVSAVFNDLYDGSAMEHKVTIGDKLYLRTKNSGDDWLVYEATDLHAPDKSGLADDASVWGDGPMPGRLLTISCIQPANLLEAAVKNAVVGWQYRGVATADGGSGQETLPEEIDQFAPPAAPPHPKPPAPPPRPPPRSIFF